MSTVALNAVLDGCPLVTDWQGRTRRLTGGEKAVLVILAHRAKADGSNVYVSIKRVTRESGFTERHILNVFSLLRDNDLLIPTEERPGKSTIYALDLDRLAAVEDEPVAAKGRWRVDGREEPESGGCPDRLGPGARLPLEAATSERTEPPQAQSRRELICRGVRRARCRLRSRSLPGERPPRPSRCPPRHPCGCGSPL